VRYTNNNKQNKTICIR